MACTSQPHLITSTADAWTTVRMETLAHISARTTKKDDDRFRAQARAYLGFKPARRISHKHERAFDEAHETGLHLQGRKRPAEEVSKAQIYQDPGVGIPRARRSIIESPPATRTNIRNDQQRDLKENKSAESPISPGRPKPTHTSSARTPLQRLEDAQTYWRNRRPYRSTNNAPPSSTGSPRILKAAMPSSTQLEDTQLAATFLESQLPGAYSFSTASTDDMNGKVDALQTENLYNELSIHDSPASPQPLGEQDQCGMADTASQRHSSGKRSEDQKRSSPDGRPLLTYSDQSTGGQSLSTCKERGGQMTHEDPVSDRGHNDKLSAILAELPQTINSPHPIPEYLRLEGTGTSMTQTLQTVISQKDFLERYRPAAVIREPSAFERGFWRIDTASWSVETQLEFWQFMQGFIGRGRAGIGTTCTRNMMPGGTVDACSHGRLGVVRLYCWGELVKPIFLLAYLGSKGFVRTVNPQWISAATNKVVIQMP
jgi:hypothetical protein